MIHRSLQALMLVVVVASLGCTHPLQVKNLRAYASVVQLGQTIENPKIGIMPFSGTPDALFYFNAVVRRLSIDPGVGEVRTDYTPKLAEHGAFNPDVIVSIVPTVEYRSSGWNFLINWPGFLILTPSWNGYVYRADVATAVSIYAGDGNPVDQINVYQTYNIRHAEMDRTIFTGLTWLEFSALAFLGGIYNANTFDRDLIPDLLVQIKDNYAEYVISQVQGRVATQAEVFRKGRQKGSPARAALAAVGSAGKTESAAANSNGPQRPIPLGDPGNRDSELQLEARLWDATALNARDPAPFREYLKQAPQGSHAALARDHVDWANAERAYDPELVGNYLAEHPEGAFVRRATTAYSQKPLDWSVTNPLDDRLEKIYRAAPKLHVACNELHAGAWAGKKGHIPVKFDRRSCQGEGLEYMCVLIGPTGDFPPGERRRLASAVVEIGPAHGTVCSTEEDQFVFLGEWRSESSDSMGRWHRYVEPHFVQD